MEGVYQNYTGHRYSSGDKVFECFGEDHRRKLTRLYGGSLTSKPVSDVSGIIKMLENKDESVLLTRAESY